jgi:hypothetical protein
MQHIERTNFGLKQFFFSSLFLFYFWSIHIHIICHKHNVERPIYYFYSRAQAHGSRYRWFQSWISVLLRNQINSSNWLMATSCWPRLNGLLDKRLVQNVFSVWELSKRWQLFFLGIFITENTKFQLFFFCLPPPRRPSTQLNYIRFINLASSVSRRERKKNKSEIVWQSIFQTGEKRKKSFGIRISMKANKNQTTWLFPCWKCVIMCCYIFSLTRFSLNVPSERKITLRIDVWNKTEKKTQKPISLQSWRWNIIYCHFFARKTINIVSETSKKVENKIINAFKKTI